jgi:hypothetical protein
LGTTPPAEAQGNGARPSDAAPHPSLREPNEEMHMQTHDTGFHAEYGAVVYILGAPSIWARTSRYVGRDDFDWSGLLAEAETMSGGEALLVRVAYELWNAEKTVGLWEIARRLDPRAFARVLEALAMCRGRGFRDLRAA